MAKYLDEAGAEQLNQLLAAKFDTKVDKVLATKTYENILGKASDTTWAENTFYFGSVKPISFTDIWSVRYRIYVWVESDANYRAMATVLYMGSQSNLASYAVFNNIYSTSYRPAYYHVMYRLLQAGFNAGYGHALGVSLRDSNAKDTAGKERTIKIELLEQINCNVTLLDGMIKWADWEGANATNYSGFGNAPPAYNFSTNGLQETGDANDNTIAYTIKSYYEKPIVGAGNVYKYNLCTYDSDWKIQGFVNSASTGTTKTKNTATYRINAPLFYLNSGTNGTVGGVIGDNLLLTQHSGIDFRYSSNCGATLTQNQPVFLVGVPASASTYTLADTWWTQTLPSAEDGKIYILLGYCYSTNKYSLSWLAHHPIYEYKNGAVRLYQAPITSSDITTALGYTPYSAANPNGYTSNTGTITKVQANGTDVASSGTANIPAATTSKYGVTELSSATNSTSEVLAATPKAVKAAYDLAASKGTGTITGVSVNGTSVATSGVANITSVPASILSGAIPSAVTATTQTQGDNSTKIATTAYVDTAIDNLPDPMIFKGSLGTGGTITALPVDGSANIGDTYKVITAGTYASKAAKVGDTFICLTKTSSANTWELIPSGDEPSGTVTSVTIKATSPIAIDSSSAITTSGTRTLSHANSGVTAGTYKSVTVNATGHITAGENPTTLAGYGITDAKIANGVITLGSNTITPITSTSDKVSKSGDTMTGGLSTPDLTIGGRTTGSTVGDMSVAQGSGVIASGLASLSQGSFTTASAQDAHAEGYYSSASAQDAHAEGYYSQASGANSHAEGNYAIAMGQTSHAEGTQTIAFSKSQHVQGEYNVMDSSGSTTTRGTYAQIIGNGTSTTRSNAATVKWNGEAWFQGDIYTGSTSGTNKDSGSKKLATENYVTTSISGKENTSNKVTSLSSSSTNTQYPSAKLVYDQLALKQTKIYTDLTEDLYFVDGTAPTLPSGMYYCAGHSVYINGTKQNILSSNPFYFIVDEVEVGEDQWETYYTINCVVGTSFYSAICSTDNNLTWAIKMDYLLKRTNIDTSIISPTRDTQVPSTKLFVTQLATKQNTLSQGTNITISGNTISAMDTKNTAGSTNTSSKIYLIGATSQAANPQTYSDDEVYATSGTLTAKEFSLGTNAKIVYNTDEDCIEFNFLS